MSQPGGQPSPGHTPSPAGPLFAALTDLLEGTGLLRPPPAEHSPLVEHVCANCPICQGAAIVERIDLHALADAGMAVANLLSGVASALLNPDGYHYPPPASHAPPEAGPQPESP